MAENTNVVVDVQSQVEWSVDQIKQAIKEAVESFTENKSIDDRPAIKALVEDITVLRNEDIVAYGSLEEPMGELVNLYTHLCRQEMFENLMAFGGGVETLKQAVMTEQFDSIKVKKTTEKETKTIKESVEPVKRNIDLLQLDLFAKKSKKTIGFDPDWIDYVQALNCVLTIREGQKLVVPDFETHNLQSIVKRFNLSEKAKPYVDEIIEKLADKTIDEISQTKVSEMATVALQKMFGEKLLDKTIKCRTHDARYLIAAFSKKGKNPRTLQVADHRDFMDTMRDVANCVITGSKYDIVTKNIK